VLQPAANSAHAASVRVAIRVVFVMIPPSG
jgi:hypothetical protein